MRLHRNDIPIFLVREGGGYLLAIKHSEYVREKGV